jgi:hypothetical protein
LTIILVAVGHMETRPIISSALGQAVDALALLIGI